MKIFQMHLKPLMHGCRLQQKFICISTKLQACLSRYDLLLPPGIKRLIIFRETSRYKKLTRGKDKIDKIYILA